MIPVLGAVAALFGLALLVFPSVRVGQRRLPPSRAAGLWVSGLGFLLLARAAFIEGPEVRGVVVTGVLLAVAGNMIQRYVTKTRL